MATTIRRTPGRKPYPWESWTDGKARRAMKGDDFKCSPIGFSRTLYSYADRHGFSVRVSIGGKAVEFQFSKKAKK